MSETDAITFRGIPMQELTEHEIPVFMSLVLAELQKRRAALDAQLQHRINMPRVETEIFELQELERMYRDGE